MTIDDLAGMMSRFENRIVGRIDGIEKEMKTGFAGVQSQLDNICLNYTSQNEHALALTRIKRLENKAGIR